MLHPSHHARTQPDKVVYLMAGIRVKYDVSSLQAAVHAAAPCPVDVKQKMIDWCRRGHADGTSASE